MYSAPLSMPTGYKKNPATVPNEIASGVYNASAPTLSDGDQAPLQLDTNGKLIVSATFSGSISGNAAAGPTGAAVPASADYIGINVGGNLVGVSASNPLPISGTISASNPSVSTTGTAIPASATMIGASDGTNLDALKVESAANPNLRVGIYSGANETTVTASNALKVDGSAVTQPVSNAGTFAVQVSSALPAGTNVIGHVIADSGSTTAVTQATAASLNATVVGTGTFSVQNTAATPAGTNLIGQVSASNETSTVYSGTTALTPTFSTIVASASGATTIVALVSSKKIRVLALQLVANAAVNVKWQSHVTPTDLTGLAYLAANGGYVLPYNPVGWFQTNTGEALDINLSGAVAVGGSLTYVAV